VIKNEAQPTTQNCVYGPGGPLDVKIHRNFAQLIILDCESEQLKYLINEVKEIILRAEATEELRLISRDR